MPRTKEKRMKDKEDKDDWVDEATENAHGQFRAKAKKRGLSTRAMVSRVLANPSKYDKKTVKQAQLAKTLMAMGK